MTAWALYLVVVSALLSVAARALEAGLAMQGRAIRFVWLAALLGCVMVPGVMQVLPGPVLPAGAVDLPAWVLDAGVVGGAGDTERSWYAKIRPTDAVDRAVGWAWLVSVAVAFVGLCVWVMRVSAAPRGWPSERLDGADVRIAPGAGPAVFGVVRPSIVVPRWLLGCPVEVRRLALLHEREHIAARDPALLMMGAALVALMPWNPIAWWLLVRLRAAVELDCDRRVLRRGVSLRDYGGMLLGVAGRGSSPVLAAALVEPARLLERRIVAMTRNVRTRPFSVLGVCALGAVALAAACALDSPAGVDEAEPRPATLESKVSPLATAGGEGSVAGLLHAKLSGEDGHAVMLKALSENEEHLGATGIKRHSEVFGTLHKRLERSPAGPLIRIDGEEATEAMMKAMSPDAIERIEILKGAAAAQLGDKRAQNGVISIFTKKQ